MTTQIKKLYSMPIKKLDEFCKVEKIAIRTDSGYLKGLIFDE